MRLILASLFVFWFASSVSAQVVEVSINLNEFGLIGMDFPTPIDADGNSATQEWLFQTTDGPHQLIKFAVAVERPGGLCFEDWFQIPGFIRFSRIKIAERYGRSKILVWHMSFTQDQPFMVVSLNIVRCR